MTRLNSDAILDLLAERDALRQAALKAFTIVEWVVGEGRVLTSPHFDADATLLELVSVLGVKDSADARCAVKAGAKRLAWHPASRLLR